MIGEKTRIEVSEIPQARQLTQSSNLCTTLSVELFGAANSVRTIKTTNGKKASNDGFGDTAILWITCETS